MTPTRIVVTLTLFGLLLYDTWAMLVHGYSWTISKDLRQLAMDYPIVSFGVGVVVGHLWWRHPSDDKKNDQTGT